MAWLYDESDGFAVTRNAAALLSINHNIVFNIILENQFAFLLLLNNINQMTGYVGNC